MQAFSFVLGILFVICLTLVWYVLRPWFRVFCSGGRVSLWLIIGMQLRRTNINLVTDAYQTLIQSGSKVPMRELEREYLVARTKISNSQDLVDLINRSPNVGLVPLWLNQDEYRWLSRTLSNIRVKKDARGNANWSKIVERLQEAGKGFTKGFAVGSSK